MTKYFFEEEKVKAKKQFKFTLFWYIAVAFIYLILSIGFMIWYRTLPYQSPKIPTVKIIHHVVSFIFVFFSFLYLMIPFKRIKRYYKMTRNLSTGLRENFEAEFLRYDDHPQEKDGVDMKKLIFKEWNKYKKVYFERKVLIPYEKEYPVIPEHAYVKFITEGNVLISYEIVEKINNGEEK